MQHTWAIRRHYAKKETIKGRHVGECNQQAQQRGHARNLPYNLLHEWGCVANLTCDKHVHNKAFSYKTISGGNMRVGSLVRTTYPNTKVGIIICIDPDLVKCCFGWVYKKHLEVLCK